MKGVKMFKSTKKQTNLDFIMIFRCHVVKWINLKHNALLCCLLKTYQSQYDSISDSLNFLKYQKSVFKKETLR